MQIIVYIAIPTYEVQHSQTIKLHLYKSVGSNTVMQVTIGMLTLKQIIMLCKL